jgi:tellurium resistance protein TerD
MSVISLDKGEKVNLTKGNSKLTEVVVELGWTAQTRKGQPDFDLDASIIALGADGMIYDPKELERRTYRNFVFYNNQVNEDASIESLSGDNLTGDTEGGVCETIAVRFDKLNKVPAIKELVVVVTIHDYQTRKQNFGQVTSSFVQIRDPVSGNVLVRHDPTEDYSTSTALIMARLYKQGQDWKIEAIGQGIEGGLKGICIKYGIPV